MYRERFWVGLALIAVPLGVMLLTTRPLGDPTYRGPLEGHVSIHGHPMTGGFILFVADDPLMNTVIGRLDKDGNYRIGPRRERVDIQGETRFRICIVPERKRSSGATSVDPDAARVAEVGADGGYGPVVASNVRSGLSRRLSDPRTSPLAVQLSTAPIHVDITL